MLTECVDLARLIVIRLEPAFTGLRTAIAERGGARAALVGLLQFDGGQHRRPVQAAMHAFPATGTGAPAQAPTWAGCGPPWRWRAPW